MMLGTGFTGLQIAGMIFPAELQIMGMNFPENEHGRVTWFCRDSVNCTHAAKDPQRLCVCTEDGPFVSDNIGNALSPKSFAYFGCMTV